MCVVLIKQHLPTSIVGPSQTTLVEPSPISNVERQVIGVNRCAWIKICRWDYERCSSTNIAITATGPSTPPRISNLIDFKMILETLR